MSAEATLTTLRRLLTDAGTLADAAGDAPGAAELAGVRARLDEPLRVAIAGKVKAGKSTLLNALIGERIAPTDAGECTRIVTWYQASHTSRVTIERHDGTRIPTSYRRGDDGALEVDLAGHDPAAVRRLVVEWPSRSLASMTLIDTPGLFAATGEASQRTVDFLTPRPDAPGEVDAVVYLLRHVHADDVRFLETFHDRELAQPSPVNTLGVLSRADEIGVCRDDALHSAERVAARLNGDARIRRLCQAVVPVAGLLAQAAAVLSEDQVGVLRAVAALGPDTREALLRSTSRFVADDAEVVVSAAQRAEVLEALGWFGIRLAVDALSADPALSGPALAGVLRDASGIEGFRSLLRTQFTARAGVLQARSAAAVLTGVLDRLADPRAAALGSELEATLAATHAHAELRLLSLLRVGVVPLPDRDDAEMLLGAGGTDPAARLGLAASCSDVEVVRAATEALARWRRRAEHPMSSRAVKDAARVLTRTCEGLLAAPLAAASHGDGSSQP